MSGSMVSVGCNSTKDRSTISKCEASTTTFQTGKGNGEKYGLPGPSDNVNGKKNFFFFKELLET